MDRAAGRPPSQAERQEEVRLKQENEGLRQQVKVLEGAILIRDAMDGVPRFTTRPAADTLPSSRSKKKP